MSKSEIEKIKAVLSEINEARNKASSGVWQTELIGDGVYDYQTWLVHDGKTGYGNDNICDVDTDKTEVKENAEFIALAANKITSLTKVAEIAVDYIHDNFNDPAAQKSLKQISEILVGK